MKNEIGDIVTYTEVIYDDVGILQGYIEKFLKIGNIYRIS